MSWTAPDTQNFITVGSGISAPQVGGGFGVLHSRALQPKPPNRFFYMWQIHRKTWDRVVSSDILVP